MKQILLVIFFLCLCLAIGIGVGRYVIPYTGDTILKSPFTFQNKTEELPLKQYQFDSLRERKYEASTISVDKEIETFDDYTSYLFSYSPLGKKMTGQLNVPKDVTDKTPVIVMVRGFVPTEIYSTGIGTKPAAAKLAEAGFITISPDFFGYGGSEPEPNDSWQARFEKPIIVIDLIESIKQSGIPIPKSEVYKSDNIGMWAHSNGGQIALSVLEVTKAPIPTTLWAPVTAPFPYSVLFFSDEEDDEGKAMRLWVSELEHDYDLKKFSVTQFIDGLKGPIQLHHGTADDSALKVWSDEFVAKVDKENSRRADVVKAYKKNASESAKAADPLLQTIKITYFEYPGANHNLVPSWDTVVERDITFFKKNLSVEN